jgi:glycolate oxidase FAD binding subunit
LIRGAGTKLDWGRPAGRVDAVLDMRRLNRILAHQHGDLTGTFEAGLSLRDANQALAKHGQWLPIDPAFPDQATIGGLIATNDSGALRHRYGTPRDLVIGVQIATADGTLAKAGGQVVKNVAGYDLGRLMSGSFGSLAAIVSASFKLLPVPNASKTLVVTADSHEALGLLVRKVMASQLEPFVFEVEAVPDRAALVIRFASIPAVVDAQVHQARMLLAAGGGPSTPLGASRVELLTDEAEQKLWREHQTRPWAGAGAVVRASWLPANLAAALGELRAAGTPFRLTGRAAVGAGLITIDADTGAQARVIAQLRQSQVFGNVVVLRGSADLKAQVDVWGPMGDRVPLLAAVKRALDPHNTLNAGRGPL